MLDNFSSFPITLGRNPQNCKSTEIVVCGTCCTQGYTDIEVTIHDTFLLILGESCYTAYVFPAQYSWRPLDVKLSCLPPRSSPTGSVLRALPQFILCQLYRVIRNDCQVLTTASRCNPMWFLSMWLCQGSGLCSSSSRKYPGTEGTNQNRHWNHHRWHATNSLERTRLSCWCL